MIPINTTQNATEARYALQCAMMKNNEWLLLAGQTALAELTKDNFELSVEWGKLIFTWWDKERSQSWRVTAYEIDGAEIRLQAMRGLAGELTTLTLRDEIRWRARLELDDLGTDERRRHYSELLAQLLAARFGNARLQRLTAGADRSRSAPGRYTRLTLKLGRETILAIGANDAESQSEIDGIVAAGLVWLANFNQKRERELRAQRLWFCLPKDRLQTVVERLILLDISHLQASIECFEIDERRKELTTVQLATQDELLNLHPRKIEWPENHLPDNHWRERILRLAPDRIEVRQISGRESYSINGLEFARVISGENHQVTFGVAGLGDGGRLTKSETLTEKNFNRLDQMVGQILENRSAKISDRRNPFYRLREEAWLESLLRRNITVLDAKLDDRFVYSQIPAWRGDERSVIDLLTVTLDGRLVVIEIKASEDAQLPLQGLDYWLKVEQARLRGDFAERKLFAGIKLVDQSPLLYLVAPRLRFHRIFEIVARCLSPKLEVYQIGINTNWREGVRVRSMNRINQTQEFLDE